MWFSSLKKGHNLMELEALDLLDNGDRCISRIEMYE